MRRLALLAVVACERGPSSAELDRLHAEAVAANRAAMAAHPLDYEANFSLAVSGRIGKPAATLSHDELVRLATTTVITKNVQDPESTTTKTEFRGLLVRDLLDRFDAQPDATEATFVCADAFRATVDVADARANRMLLAVEADGSPIAPDDGGPVFLIHPDDATPAYLAKYTDRFWGFYVTAMVVGTEEPRLRVGGTTFDRAALAQLRESSFDAIAGWKVEWPASPVHLRGVRLADVLAAAKVELPPHGHIIVRGKAPVHHDKAKPAGIDVDDLERCPPLLALAYGPDDTPIPARLGGPIAMAMPKCDARYDGAPDLHWITMVEDIEVVPP